MNWSAGQPSRAADLATQSFCAILVLAEPCCIPHHTFCSSCTLHAVQAMLHASARGVSEAAVILQVPEPQRAASAHLSDADHRPVQPAEGCRDVSLGPSPLLASGSKAAASSRPAVTSNACPSTLPSPCSADEAGPSRSSRSQGQIRILAPPGQPSGVEAQPLDEAPSRHSLQATSLARLQPSPGPGPQSALPAAARLSRLGQLEALAAQQPAASFSFCCRAAEELPAAADQDASSFSQAWHPRLSQQGGQLAAACIPQEEATDALATQQAGRQAPLSLSCRSSC